ncbi:MAG: TolC family protein [Prevotellaceae bacterium]|jgi:outer membrane protein TolC|nr:TolC family protein [Prevotellaceae bacterium]
MKNTIKREQRPNLFEALPSVSILRVVKKLIISILLVSATFAAQAQSGYETVLQQIEANNTTLAALRQQTEAQKLGNRTGLAPANPEVEFNYLWGSPVAIGNRMDFSVKQSFDFPTVYAHRNKIANLQNQNAELSYKAERLNILLSAKQACIKLNYYNALAREYAVRLQNAERIAIAYKSKLDKGETNILEHNKAQLNLTTVQTELAEIETEQTTLLSELKRLNGGKELSTPNFQYPTSELPANFEDWYTTAERKSPLLQYVSAQIEINKQEIKLNRALWLPKFSAGYMSEKVVGQHFQGITVGVSVPLWENKNQIKQAKAQAQAAEETLNDSKTQFYSHLQTLYQKAFALQQNARKVKQSLADNNNEPLLKKALDAGEISLLNYLLEVEFYYNAINKVLEAERDYELAIAELWVVEM